MKDLKAARGFTLVELLVVISIIALLLSILIPALSRARDLGRRAVCLSNVRTLGLAWTAYASANQDNLVGGIAGVKGTTADQSLKALWYAWVEIPQDKNGKYTGGAPRNPQNGLEVLNASLEDEIRGIEKGLLYKYINDVKPYHCVSDNRNNSIETAWRSYSIGAGMCINWTEYESSNCIKNAMKTTQIKVPSSKYVFVENRDARGWNAGFWDVAVQKRANGVFSQWWNVVAGWHKKCSNWGFADGHAETQVWKDKKTINICTEPDYTKQAQMIIEASRYNVDLKWIVDRRMNNW